MEYFKIFIQQFKKDYQLEKLPTEPIHIQKSIPFTEESMKYLNGTPFLNFVYFGTQLFISADSKIYDFAYNYAIRYKNELYRVFDAPNVFYLNQKLEDYGYTVAHLAQYFLPSIDKEIHITTDFPIRFLYENEIEKLYTLKGFSMALCGATTGKRRDMIAAICEMDGQIVGVAACSNDGKEMWQIGVDVLPAYQRRGIGTALVVRLKEEIISKGKCPFYCCAWSNLASKHLAKNAGFEDAWVELTAKSLEEYWIKEIRKE